MSSRLKTVVIGFYGTTLDSGVGEKRWKRWRPTLSVFQHEDLLVDRLELLCPPRSKPETLMEDIARLSPETVVHEHRFETRDPWDFGDVYAALHDFTRSYAFDPEQERYLIHLTTGTHVAQICMFLLTETGFFPGKLLQTGPPTKLSHTPTYQIIDLDLSRYDQIATRFEAERKARTRELRAGITTRNVAFNTLIDEIEHVASRSKAPILLSGSTGVGKTHLARRIYGLKSQLGQVSGEWVEVNCATLRGDQAMSTLFGHTRGAFTGADRSRTGLLQKANRGVLFLDEIGELGLDEQAMLLTAIEDKRFVPVGGEDMVQSDFQLIAGTNRELGEEVQRGRFRKDLLARIDLWHFRLPSLRDRLEDIAPNIDYELDRQRESTGRAVTMNTEARHLFLQFAIGPEGKWENGFRDLSASISRLTTLATGGRITTGDVATELDRLRSKWTQSISAYNSPLSPTSDRLGWVLEQDAIDQLDLFDQLQLRAVVEECGKSKSLADAGRRLFAQSRVRKKSSNDADRIRKYLARFGLSGKDVLA